MDQVPSRYSDEQKLLNDHDLRALVEKNVEVRHQETITVVLLSVTIAALVAVLRNHAAVEILHPGNWRSQLALPMIGIIDFFAGLILRKNLRDAERRMMLTYRHLATRNSLGLHSFVTLHGVIPRKYRSKRSRIRKPLTRNRDFLPTVAMWAGALLIIAPTPVALFYSFINNYHSR